MSEAFAYDVFLSYSQADAKWVRGELLPRLERAGLKVCIDYRDFAAGAPKLTEPERAITSSRKTVLVLTPTYLTDGWDEFENLLLQTLDPASRQRRLIPLRKEPCNPPLRLGMLTPVDFADPDSAPFVWRQLLTALGAPPAPEEVPQPSAANWHLAHPYPMQPNFTGRVAERQQLSDWLKSPHHPLLVLRALGGFGKSALTWYWLTHDIDPRPWPRLVFWSFYEGDASFERFLRETLVYLGDNPGTLGLRQQVDALLHHLMRPGTLLVLDGFERQLRAFSGMNAAYQGDEINSGESYPEREPAGREGHDSAAASTVRSRLHQPPGRTVPTRRRQPAHHPQQGVDDHPHAPTRARTAQRAAPRLPGN